MRRAEACSCSTDVMEPTLSAQLMRSVLESAPDAMLIVDAHGAILFASRQMSALFGYSGQQTTRLRVEDLLPERSRAAHRAHRERFLREQRTRVMGIGLELLARRKDGSHFPVEISLSPIQDGERNLVTVAIRDVTAHKRIEAALLEARQVAERATQAKGRFLATASHDLRQPLQSLALLNGALKRLVSEPQAHEALCDQERAIGAMSHLLNALLDMSKLDSGAVHPQPADFDIGPLFAEREQEFASVAADKQLALRVRHGGQCAHCDAALLGQILRNLVSNAIKYTTEGSVALTCTGTGQAIRIEVSDTGVGIDAAQLPHIYDEFYRIERAGGTRRTPRRGIRHPAGGRRFGGAQCHEDAAARRGLLGPSGRLDGRGARLPCRRRSLRSAHHGLPPRRRRDRNRGDRAGARAAGSDAAGGADHRRHPECGPHTAERAPAPGPQADPGR